METARIYRVLSRIVERKISGLIDGWRLKSECLRGFLGGDADKIVAWLCVLLVMRGSGFGLKGRHFMWENGKISPCFKLRKQAGLAGQIWLSAREKVSVYAVFWTVRRSKSVRGGVFR